VVVPIASVMIALASLFIGLSARRKELTCVFLGTEKLVSVSNSIAPDLSVQYRGHAVTSMTKMIYVLRNAGAVAVKGSDVVEPIELDYPVGTKILNANVDKTLPSDFSITIAQKSPDSVSLNFALLNPGDEVYFGVYIYDSEPKSPALRGRIVDVQLLQTSDVRDSQGRALPFILNAATRAVIFWTLLLVNAAFGAIVFGFWVYAVKFTIVAGNWRHRWKEPFAAAIDELKETDKFEYDWLKNRIDEFGKANISLNPNAKKLLQQKGIPEPPLIGFGTVSEGLGYTVLLWGLTTFFTFTCLYIYTAPR